MNSNPIWLTFKLSAGLAGPSEHIGELDFNRLRVEANGQKKGLKVGLKLVPSPQFRQEHPHARWLSMSATFQDQFIQQEVFGRVIIEANSGVPLLDQPSHQIEWLWMLGPADVERIERRRSAAATAPLHFQVDVTGIIQTEAGPFMVGGEGNIEIAVSDWLGHIGQLGYGVPPSIQGLVGASVLDHPGWRTAEKRLADARRALQQGDDHAALAECLREFEAEVTQPYAAASWKGRFNMPTQKEDGVCSALSGHCTFLNKIGHHRSRKDRDAAGALTEMPLDHWEAEAAVAASHFWLAYAIRAKT